MVPTAKSPLGGQSDRSLPARVQRQILARNLCGSGETLVLAVSGGLDSMVLLDLFHQWAAVLQVELVVAHLDHQLRVASKADALFVQRQAAQRGLDCVVAQAEVAQWSQQERVSLEMAARQLRHEFLARTARRAGARTVVLGHHLDDQLELFLLRLLRGAGGSGLAGMNWSSRSAVDHSVRLVRPLLGETRAALTEYAMECRVPFRRDITNRGLEPLRNRIRHRLLPLLRRDYQPAITQTFCRTIEIVGAEADFVEQAAARWIAGRRRSPFARLHVALQRAVLRRQLWALQVPAEFRLVEELRTTAARPVTVRPGRILIREPAGWVREGHPVRTEFGQACTELALEGRAGECQFGGLRVAWQRVAAHGRRGLTLRRPGVERFDAAKVGERVMLRHWRPGDRFQPLGMPRTVKLQNLFVNARIQREQRRRAVVATTGSGEIFWVEGLRMAEAFRLDKRSQQRLKWQWHRTGSDVQW
jgi:tRNA(Ile)-lysidine synthase